MVQFAALQPITAVRDDRLAHSRSRRRLALALAVLAAFAGFAAGAAWAAPAPTGMEADLGRLLRLMAVLKVAMAAGAAWLVDWRLRAPITPRLAVGYPMSVALMAAAPGLIWHLVPVIAGALVFHAGLVLILLLAYVDRDGTRGAFAAAGAARVRAYTQD